MSKEKSVIDPLMNERKTITKVKMWGMKEETSITGMFKRRCEDLGESVELMVAGSPTPTSGLHNYLCIRDIKSRQLLSAVWQFYLYIQVAFECTINSICHKAIDLT